MKQTIGILTMAGLVASAVGSSQAAWVINEVETESTGANVQYVELYNTVAGQSVAGLTVLDIRSSTGRAVTAVNLSGSATTKYYLIGNALYASSAASLSKPAPDAQFSLDLRGQYHQVLLVNTADLPGGFTADPTTGYVFTGTEFSNGAQIIDSVQLTDGATDPVFFASQNEQAISYEDPLTPDSPFSCGRVPDGGAWNGNYPINPAASPSIYADGTPGAANVAPAAVSDWQLY